MQTPVETTAHNSLGILRFENILLFSCEDECILTVKRYLSPLFLQMNPFCPIFVVYISNYTIQSALVFHCYIKFFHIKN